MTERQFVVGPNASGKSNFLDAFRFLRDLASQQGGGLQKAVADRGGVSKIRSLHARKDPTVKIAVELKDASESAETLWKYALSIRQETRGTRLPYLEYERVWKAGQLVHNRPDEHDQADPERLKQTSLEQVNANFDFRALARFFDSITYLHLVPQLLRYADIYRSVQVENDPFGQAFLERVAATTTKTRDSRFRKIEGALQVAVPNLKNLGFERDEITGQPHLRAIYEHWRQDAGWQREDQFSDGTLRLLGLFWSLLEGDSLLLLEEPELSLNQGIVEQLGAIFSRLQRQRRRQLVVSTHSEALLNDRGISGREVLVLTPTKEGTEAEIALTLDEVAKLLRAGFSVGHSIAPRIRPKTLDQLTLFGS